MQHGNNNGIPRLCINNGRAHKQPNMYSFLANNLRHAKTPHSQGYQLRD